MAEGLPVDFDPQQISPFLEKIARDCDAELRAIAEQRDLDIARLNSEAHAASRRLFRHGADQLRARLELERSRYLARLRSDLRRQHWDILAEAQQRLLETVSERFDDAWKDPQRQWEWCRYWLHIFLNSDVLD